MAGSSALQYSLAEWENAPSSAGLLGIFVGLTLKAKPWALFFLPRAQSTCGRCCRLSVQSKFVCRLVQYLLFWVAENAKLHWEEILFLQVFSGISEGSSEGLEYRKPKTISRRMELEHLVNLATLLPLPLVEKTSSPLPVPFPGFLNYSVLIQRCYLPNTFPTHSCQFCLFNVPDPQLPSQPLFPVFIALKVTLGPQTQELIFWPVGWNKAVNHCRLCCCILLANRPLPFYKQPHSLMLNLFSLLFDVHFKINKTPRAGLLSRPVSPIK